MKLLKELSKSWSVRILIVAFVFLGLLPLGLKGLEFGMDFTGGSLIQLELEKTVDENAMGTITQILENRLNGFGLKDISVRGWGDKFVIVEVAEQEGSSLDALKNILSKQGRFEAVIDEQVVLRSNDLVQIITNPQEGYGYLSSTGKWQVPFVISAEGSKTFAQVAKGKCAKVGEDVECERIFMFIDRPENAAILMPVEMYAEEQEMRIDPLSQRSFPIEISEFERNTITPIFPFDDAETVVDDLVEGGFSQIIIPENHSYNLAVLEDAGLEVVVRPKLDHYWLWTAVNLKSILFLTPGVTSGEPIREALITGGAENLVDAQAEMTEMVVLLKSGRLPVGVEIVSTVSVSPTLGQNFLRDSIWIAAAALLAVALVVFLRYRRPWVTVAIVVNDICEVVIILGIASIINWQIDLAAMAGLIAAVGTGVDHLIVITDEAIHGTGDTDASVVTRIQRAFGIVFIAAATTIMAMFPLMTLGLGLLKGFAITTIIGVCVGVFIVRPVFAKILEKIIK